MPKLPAKSDFSEWFSAVVGPEGAALADIRYGVQGLIVHMPYGMRILRKIYDLLEQEVEADGHEPVLFPTFIKAENLEKEKEHAGFTPEVFWVEKMGSNMLEEKLAMRPTGETQFYPMFSLWVRSHNQLPLKTYQSRITVFRGEKQTRPFLRGREFMFFETHDVFANHDDVQKQIKSDMRIMQNVITHHLKLPFYFLRRPKWDAFLGADATYVGDTILPDGKRNQLSSTHDLGQNFSKAFDITFLNEAGESVHAYQTCFGPGIWRIMAALIAIHGDDQGLALPSVVAPVQVVIVPIFKTEEEEALVRGAVAELETHIPYRFKSDWSKQTPGFKFNEWELKGVPIRMELGPKDLQHGTVVIKRRFGTKIVVPMKECKDALHKEMQAHDHDLHTRAQIYFLNNAREARDLKEIVQVLDQFRGFVITNWCDTTGKVGEACAEKLKEATQGAYVCGERIDETQHVPSGALCAVCGKPARHRVYVAKSI